MKDKIILLYSERARFGGYMLALVLFWHKWMKHQIKIGDKFWADRLSHNSVVFIERGIARIRRENYKARMKELRQRWSS